MTGAPQALRGEQRRRVAAILATRFTHDGVSVLELAAQIGRRPCTVRRLLVEAGVQDYTHACIGPSDDAVVAALVTRARDGSTVENLSTDTGIDPRALRRMLREAGVAVAERHPAPIDQKPRIVRRYKSGASIRQLAAETCSNYGSIRRILLASGVPLRTSHGNRMRGTEHRS